MKGALIIIVRNLEEQAVDWRESIRILVPVNKTAATRLTRYWFKLKGKDKPRVDLKYLAHYICKRYI